MSDKRVRHTLTTGEVDWSGLTKAQLNAKLLRSCATRNAALAEQALIRGADVNCRGRDLMTSLHVATEHGDVEMIRLIGNQRNVKIDAQTIYGERMNPQYRVTYEDYYQGLTPLHTSIFLGHRAAARELLSKGASPNAKDNLGRTPLHYAALQMDVECARILLKHGARVNTYDAFDETPLYTAVLKSPCDPMVRLLLARRASVVPPARKLALGLFLEAVLGARVDTNQSAIEAFIRSGGNVNTTDPIGWRTPLHLVAMNGHYELAEYLIRHGANLDAKNRAGHTPMDVALNCKNLNIARLIEEKRATVHRGRNSLDDRTTRTDE